MTFSRYYFYSQVFLFAGSMGLETFCHLASCFIFLYQMGNPWEIVRNDVSYPVKFYGRVVPGSDGKKQWIGGEDISAVAYDVPIPGYKTKTTINLRLWSTKVPSKEFDLSAFNAGEHSTAADALSNAEKVQYFSHCSFCVYQVICKFCHIVHLCILPTFDDSGINLGFYLFTKGMK